MEKREKVDVLSRILSVDSTLESVTGADDLLLLDRKRVASGDYERNKSVEETRKKGREEGGPCSCNSTKSSPVISSLTQCST